MPRNSFQDRLWALRGEVGALGDRVLDQYWKAIRVLESGDRDKGTAVIDGDEAINDWYLDIESTCLRILALEQPVAGDLRLVASSFKIVTDLERIGDLATNLARYGIDSGGRLSESVALEPIATTAGEMVEVALDAYARDDATAAREVASRDDDLDRRCRTASETVVGDLLRHEGSRTAGTGQPTEADPELTLTTASRALLTIRDVERVGDHAVNICARTVYQIDHDDELLY